MHPNSSTGPHRAQSNSELLPLRLVGRWKPQAVYVRRQKDKHAIYDRLISQLENRQVVDSSTGIVLPCIFLADEREKLLKEGITPLEISQWESSHIDAAEMHPGWNVRRDYPPALYRWLARRGDEHVIADYRIVAVPNSLENALVCEQLLTMFSKTELLRVDGFVSHPDGGVRLDINPFWSRNGYIVPIQRGQSIDGLNVYRYPDDTRPFILKGRRTSSGV
jgi:hypothetical protein